MNFTFADTVVVEGTLIGVVVKSWEDGTHEVYVRNHNRIKEYHETQMQRYMVRHKELDEDEAYYQENACGVHPSHSV